MAACPCMAVVSRLSSSAFVTTTVEAQEIVSPNITAWPMFQSQIKIANTAPRIVAIDICRSAPGIASDLTAKRFRTEK